MRCPVDGEELIMTTRNGVEIDYCPKCRGIWLDRGELDKIIARTESVGGVAQPRNHRERLDDHQQHQAPPPPPHYGYQGHYGHQGGRDHHRHHHKDRYHDDRRGYRKDGYSKPRYKRRKSMLEEIIDIFD
ncbi:MAG: zf-TFIIB domain-containing protein [Alphaproteobacteria bacterium]|nr:zf-TFIIB domain-containing protein [Alphaproteobacteria bacterium SS10]